MRMASPSDRPSMDFDNQMRELWTLCDRIGKPFHAAKRMVTSITEGKLKTEEAIAIVIRLLDPGSGERRSAAMSVEEAVQGLTRQARRVKLELDNGDKVLAEAMAKLQQQMKQAREEAKERARELQVELRQVVKAIQALDPEAAKEFGGTRGGTREGAGGGVRAAAPVEWEGRMLDAGDPCPYPVCERTLSDHGPGRLAHLRGHRERGDILPPVVEGVA